jgi:transcriptional regulator with XRE-family HTH domain
LAENLRKLRAARGWSQEMLAAESQLDRSFVAHVEREGRNVSIDNIDRLARAFDISVAQLFTCSEKQFGHGTRDRSAPQEG